MKMIWLLILVFDGGNRSGVHSTTLPFHFETKDQCIAATSDLTEREWSSTSYKGVNQIGWVCVQGPLP